MIPFHTLFHADWSTAPQKRWVASATRTDSGWQVDRPRLVGDTAMFVDRLFAAAGPVLAGFDFPIGLPVSYGKRTGLADFPTALEAFGHGEWAEFFNVATTAEQVTLKRPFYPQVSTAASKQLHLLHGHGVESLDQLRRQCERPTETRRRPACPLFWTLGGNQVGKAAISGWKEVITPAKRRGATLWPFDGDLAALAALRRPVLAETYPAEAYGHVGVKFGAGMSKQRQEDRRAAMVGLCAWARQHGVAFAVDLAGLIHDGFGRGKEPEDAFDALIGLLGMIEVCDGRRRECPGDRGLAEHWEGWILGQA